MRATTFAGSPATPSKPRALHAARARPCAFSGACTNGLLSPTTARNQRGGAPMPSMRMPSMRMISPRMRWVSAISRRMRDGPSAQNHFDGWVVL